MKTTTARIGARIGIATAILAASLGLTGCIQSSAPLPNNGASDSPSLSPTATSPVGATPSATPARPKFTENCTTLLTAAQVYAYNPNYVVDSAYAPKPGSVPASIAAHGGQTCGWINETSGAEVEVAITTLPADQWAKAKAAASGGTPISSGGKTGYFAVTHGIGSAQLFFGAFWLDVSAADFATAADAETLYPVVVQNQLHAGG